MMDAYRLLGVLAFVVAATGNLLAAPSAAIGDPRIMEEAKSRGIRFPGCELLSARGILNDLSSRTQILQGELSYLQRDARTLYEEWRGLAGGGNGSLGGERASAWHLHARVNRLVESMKNSSGALRKLEDSWWKLREALQEEAASEGDVQKTGPGFDALKRGLRGSVDQVKAIDIEIEKLQEEFDYVQPEIYAYLAKEFPQAGLVPADPWHRQYDFQGAPRLRLKYDFEEAHARYMREAHESLHTSWDKPKARATGKDRGRGKHPH